MTTILDSNSLFNTNSVDNPPPEAAPIFDAPKVSDKEADEYFNSRSYGSRIGAWASDQSSILINREDLLNSIEKYKEKFHYLRLRKKYR